MSDINLVVVDPNALFRAGLVSLLSATGFGKVEAVATVEEFSRSRGGRPPPEIVLVNLAPDFDAVAAISEIAAVAPGAKIVFLAHELDISLLTACFAAGAYGYLLQDISRNALEESLKLVKAGEKVFPSRLASMMANLVGRHCEGTANGAGLSAYNFSTREVEILRCLAAGQPNKVIAATLDIAESTVKARLKGILRKTRACNRTQAAIWAFEQGLANGNSHPAAGEAGTAATPGLARRPAAEPVAHGSPSSAS
ncbi:MAG TPA: response regulator transcription factor [Alphaproteobacteria bacterium]|nr:response regulator transcription factor [Alphaproteobacteria bacterium]